MTTASGPIHPDTLILRVGMSGSTTGPAPARKPARRRRSPTHPKRGRRSLRLAFHKVYQFKIELKGIVPLIWRRIRVPEDYSFWDLHVAIQDAMGWRDCHLHCFRILNPSGGELDQIGIVHEAFADDLPMLAGWEILISRYFLKPGDRAEYEYDFGDSWCHEVTFEEILPRDPNVKYPLCVAGARACPPEDCGGPPGYENLLATLSDPDHQEHEETLTWVGGSFDPELFDPGQIKFDDPRERWSMAFGGRE